MIQMHSGLNEVGSISPIHRLTLDDKNKRLAKIPSDSTRFAWAYPLAGMGDLKEKDKETFDLSNPIHLFLLFGAFIYLDDDNHVKSIHAVGKGKQLFFLDHTRCSPQKKMKTEAEKNLFKNL